MVFCWCLLVRRSFMKKLGLWPGRLWFHTDQLEQSILMALECTEKAVCDSIYNFICIRMFFLFWKAFNTRYSRKKRKRVFGSWTTLLEYKSSALRSSCSSVMHSSSFNWKSLYTNNESTALTLAQAVFADSNSKNDVLRELIIRWMRYTCMIYRFVLFFFLDFFF